MSGNYGTTLAKTALPPMPIEISLVAEGATEYGRQGDSDQGVIPTIVRSILGDQSHGQLKFVPSRYASLPKMPGQAKGIRKDLKGMALKAATALKLARGMDILLFVVDSDRQRADRKTAIEEGFQLAIKDDSSLQDLPRVVGIPETMIEAWLLGDADAFVKAFDKEVDLPKQPEKLWGPKDDPEGDRPKYVFKRTLVSIGQKSTRKRAIGRRQLAEHLRPEQLERTCPVSFPEFKCAVETHVGPLLP